MRVHDGGQPYQGAEPRAMPSPQPRGGMAPLSDEGTLYYGDNLDVLRRYVADESVDLVYLDPPFNSNQDYNVLFAESTGDRSAAQVKAFEDTWHWDEASARAYQEVVTGDNDRVARAMEAFRALLGENDMLAYLAMMAPRLVELRRVLNPTGSIYLHCDPTASAHLRLLMDATFGPVHFRNEIVWQRSAAKGHASTRFPSAHDSLLYYVKGDESATWNRLRRPHRQEYLDSHYASVEPDTGRRYTLGDCLNPNHNRPNLTYEWHGHVRVWRWTRDKMQALHDQGRLVYTKSGMPRYKRYLDEMEGTPITSVWTDIPPLNSQAQERLGYPTQKPEALLERIIQASSNHGDIVLDPFCGCGTAVSVAQRFNRQWIGIDITHLAINLIRTRLWDAFGESAHFRVVGEPTDLAGARALADQDAFQFQCWALGLVIARPAGGVKKGADGGVDGRLRFFDEAGAAKLIVLQVKSGHLKATDIRDLRGTIDREQAAIGVMLAMEPPTAPMRREAMSAGFYRSPWDQHDYPRLQILTVQDLLGGAEIAYPAGSGANVTFKRAPKARPAAPRGRDIFEAAEGHE